jgi:hypothetical protein
LAPLEICSHQTFFSIFHQPHPSTSSINLIHEPHQSTSSVNLIRQPHPSTSSSATRRYAYRSMPRQRLRRLLQVAEKRASRKKAAKQAEEEASSSEAATVRHEAQHQDGEGKYGFNDHDNDHPAFSNDGDDGGMISGGSVSSADADFGSGDSDDEGE